jgi:hypothetical protein
MWIRCAHCQQVIGVYEPLVTMVSGRARETSRAAEPELASIDEPVYHAAGFEHFDADQSLAR